MISRGDMIGAAVLGAFFLLVLGVAEIWARLGRGKPESTRKFVHIGGGIGCLFFPMMVDSVWVVLGLAVLLTALFALGSRFDFFHSLNRVERRSRGSEYYPLAVFLTYVLAGEHLWLYVSSVLVLMVADALAALIGSRFGKVRYTVEEEKKSVEGSLAFWLVAFLAIWLPLAAWSEIPMANAILAALLVSLLVTGFEAISLGGADNLFVPLAVCVILQKITGKDYGEILYQNLSMLGMSIAVGLAVWKVRSFNAGGAIAVILFTYGAWSLGSEWWGIPILLGLLVLLLARFCCPAEEEVKPLIRVRVITHAVIPAFAILMAANLTRRLPDLYPSYLAALVMIASYVTLDEVTRTRGKRPTVLRAFLVSLASWWLVGAVPWLLRLGEEPVMMIGLLGGATVPLILVHQGCKGESAATAPEPTWTGARFLFTAASALLMLLFLWSWQEAP